jgi:hypothetical protein
MWIRHRQQAKTDQNPPKIARASAGPAEHQHADQDQGRSDLRDIEGQDLDGQRRVDVGSMHDDEGGDQVHESACRQAGDHQPTGDTALQNGGDANGRLQRLKASAGVIPSSQRSAGLDHVNAPQQQGDGAGEVHQRDRQIHVPPFFRERSSISG